LFTSLRNLYLPDGTWVGQFIDEDTAAAWAKKQGYNVAECEISTRKVERVARINVMEETNSDSVEHPDALL